MIRFDALHNVLQRAKTLNNVKAWRFAMDKKAQQLIISLNTNEQLGDEGIDADGVKLRDYSPVTMQFRSEKGLQIDHVDFKVTGQYWSSWEVEVKNDSFIIHVDEQRFGELVDELFFSEEHVGLTDENMGKLAEMIKNNYENYIREQLLY